MRRVAMLQSNYIPWKGVFDLIHRVDVFVFYDDVQYTKKDWRNHNRIPTKNGELLLTVPVLTKGRFEQPICEVEIDRSTDWQAKHARTLRLTYSKAPYFKDYEYLISDFYEAHRWEMLSDMNIYMTKTIAAALGISCEYHNSADLGCDGGKDGEKVINICRKLGCDWFLNGPASRAFMDEEKFKEAGIELNYMDYAYPKYRQLQLPFDHRVSVLDLLFNTGARAPYYIWGYRDDPGAQADIL